MPPQTITIYADGACSGNPGPGGWGAILVCDNPPGEKEISGACPQTTNNRMEITAILEAFRLLKRPCRVTVVTDSQYVANAFKQKWLERWQSNGWRTAGKKPVKNKDLWESLSEAVQSHDVTWEWIKGHAGHPYNERADALAVAARETLAAGS